MGGAQDWEDLPAKAGLVLVPTQSRMLYHYSRQHLASLPRREEPQLQCCQL